MTRIAPKLSLGIPVHNGAAYLAQLFDCLRAQTLTDFEAIILDNASTDATEQICRRVTAADPRFRYERNQRNIGAAPNFNRVFDYATGRYFKWTAHDDLMAPTYLERCVGVLDEDPSVSVCHATIQVVNAELQPLSYDPELGRYVDVDGTPALVREPSGLASSPDPARRFDDVLHGMRLCSEIFGVMRTDLLRRTSLHGSYYGSDKVLLAELALLGRIETVPEPLFIKRFHKDTSYYLTTRERAAWIDPKASFRVPQIQVFNGYLKALSLVRLTPGQRLRCVGSIARKVFNTHALSRLVLPSPDNYFGIERRSVKPAAVSALLTRLDIDRTRLAPAEAEPAKRIAALVQYLDFDNLARFRAWEVLDQIKFHKHPLPHGLVPVDDGLRARELAREDERVARVAARGRDPSEGRATPERFYTFRRGAAWLGIFRDWDVRRAFHDPLLACVEQLFSPDAGVRVAGIVGRSGTGKSVALRRLAVDLAADGLEVWWVDDQRRALDLGLPELAGLEDGRRRLVLIDDVHRLEAKDGRQLRELLARAPNMVAVVAGRNLPVGLQSTLTTGKNLFAPDEAADQLAILAKIGEVLADWAEPARALAAEPMRQARLVRLLTVLAYGRTRLPRTLEELELRFREVLSEEIFRAKEVHPGFAQALLFAAMVRGSGYDISWPSMIALADHYQPGTSFLSLLDPDSQGWTLAERLTFHDTVHDTIVFHHDDLAEGLVEAGLHGSFEPWVAFGDAWLRNALAKLVQVGSARSRSLALDGLTRMFPDLLSGDELRTALRARSKDGRAPLSGAAS
jgi:glycosyltransferase involved in cell wall biosynthesis